MAKSKNCMDYELLAKVFAALFFTAIVCIGGLVVYIYLADQNRMQAEITELKSEIRTNCRIKGLEFPLARE